MKFALLLFDSRVCFPFKKEKKLNLEKIKKQIAKNQNLAWTNFRNFSRIKSTYNHLQYSVRSWLYTKTLNNTRKKFLPIFIDQSKKCRFSFKMFQPQPLIQMFRLFCQIHFFLLFNGFFTAVFAERITKTNANNYVYNSSTFAYLYSNSFTYNPNKTSCMKATPL